MEVILTHEHTDFDALASLLAASKLFPEAIPVLPHNLNRNLRDFLVLYRSSLPFRRADELPRRPVEQAIYVDTQTAQAVRGMTHDTVVRIIDHHPREPELPARCHYWGEPVGSTTTLLLEQIISRGISVSSLEATLLLLGIYEDTGGLFYVTTTARDLRCGAWLLEKGANLEVVNSFLHHPLTPDQQALLKRLNDGAEALDVAGHTIVIATAAADAYIDEISTLAHKMRDLYDPDGLFLIVDLRDRIQVVARSTTKHIDVGVIATKLGGGGHARAAAALIRNQDLPAVRAQLMELLREHIYPPVTVRQIMSWGVDTITRDTPIGEVDERMRRRGHEGFPVVEDGKLLGLVTRREVDRAMHHVWHKEPVRRIIREGSTTVDVNDSVQTLQKKMMEAGWGQVPVVENGKMVGIVTRTDLLKLWTTPADEMTPPSVALKMQTGMSTALIHLLRAAGQAAAELGYPLYAVGGFVRDLLLGLPNLDVDLVVEGDAAHLARRLAAQQGGRVRAHRQFGTAKWIRDENAFSTGKSLTDATPSSLDFATARTEFYEQATALPVVESSNIKLDLHRRDFTINTLAVRLDPPHWGELLDFYGGQRDLEAGLIRVLHSLSFVEDPTRILRAARFEQRFGFRIEPRTEELIVDAVNLLPRVSGARIRHEFNLIFQERQPEDALNRLQQLRALPALHPDLCWQEHLPDKFRALRLALSELPAPPTDVERLYFALWLRRLPSGVQSHMLDYLRVNAFTRSLVHETAQLHDREPDLLAPHLPASLLDQLLAPYNEATLLVARIDADDPIVAQRLRHYETELRPVRTHITGERLRDMQIPPGPIYRTILATVRAARIDGKIHTEAEEMALVETTLAQKEVKRKTSHSRSD